MNSGNGKGCTGGTGKGYKGGAWSCNGNCRSPGKAIGEGLNYYANDGCHEAWGNEYYDYNCEGYGLGYGDDCVGNLTMMLEKCGGESTMDIQTTEKEAGEDDMGPTRKMGEQVVLFKQPTTRFAKIQNSFDALNGDGDDGDDAGEGDDDDIDTIEATGNDWKWHAATITTTWVTKLPEMRQLLVRYLGRSGPVLPPRPDIERTTLLARGNAVALRAVDAV